MRRTWLPIVAILVLGGCDPIETGLIDLHVMATTAEGEVRPVEGARCSLITEGVAPEDAQDAAIRSTDAEGRAQFSGAQVGGHAIRCFAEAERQLLGGVVEVEVPLQAGRPGWVSATLELSPVTAPMSVEAAPEVGGAQVWWTAPSSAGGASVLGYQLRTLPKGPTLEVGAEVMLAEVTGLEAGAVHTFEVAARTVHGLGPAAVSKEVVIPSPPGSPTQVLAIPQDGAARVSWKGPEDDGGSPILAFHVFTKPETTRQSVDGAATMLLFTGLESGVPYQFTVIAENAVGEGLPSVPSAEVVPTLLPITPPIGEDDLSAWTDP